MNEKRIDRTRNSYNITTVGEIKSRKRVTRGKKTSHHTQHSISSEIGIRDRIGCPAAWFSGNGVTYRPRDSTFVSSIYRRICFFKEVSFHGIYGLSVSVFQNPLSMFCLLLFSEESPALCGAVHGRISNCVRFTYGSK